MDIFHAIVLAAIEGITEFLPISSSGHVTMALHVMQVPSIGFLKTVEIALELGAIAAVVSLYWRTFLLDWEIDLKVLTAFVPTVLIGVLLYKVFKKMFLGNDWVIVWAWFLGGSFIILIERFYPIKGDIKEMKKITYPQALMIGACQALGVIPGVSRSAAVMVSGLILGIERRTIVEFSFLLAVPTLLVIAVYGLIKADADITPDQWGILSLGFLVSFFTAWGTIKFLLHFVKHHQLTAFGIYRVIAALIAGFMLNLLLS